MGFPYLTNLSNHKIALIFYTHTQNIIFAGKTDRPAQSLQDRFDSEIEKHSKIFQRESLHGN